MASQTKWQRGKPEMSEPKLVSISQTQKQAKLATIPLMPLKSMRLRF